MAIDCADWRNVGVLVVLALCVLASNPAPSSGVYGWQPGEEEEEMVAAARASIAGFGEHAGLTLPGTRPNLTKLYLPAKGYWTGPPESDRDGTALISAAVRNSQFDALVRFSRSRGIGIDRVSLERVFSDSASVADVMVPLYLRTIGEQFEIVRQVAAEIDGSASSMSERGRLEALVEYVQAIPYGSVHVQTEGRWVAGWHPPNLLRAFGYGDCESKAVLAAAVWRFWWDEEPVFSVGHLRGQWHVIVGFPLRDTPGDLWKEQYRGRNYYFCDLTRPCRMGYLDPHLRKQLRQGAMRRSGRCGVLSSLHTIVATLPKLVPAG